MTDKNYPPLPRPAWDKRTICTTGDAYTEHQMRAYIDADRAQRKPLTDEQVFDALPGGLMDCLNDPWDEGHGDGDTMRSLRKDVMRVVRTVEALQGINPPPRPDAGNN